MIKIIFNDKLIYNRLNILIQNWKIKNRELIEICWIFIFYIEIKHLIKISFQIKK